MVQNKPDQPKRPRGRPRAYDPDAALAQAMELFWTTGYAATSLDQLGDATGMNRPSLYGAFGDKRELYLKVLQRYREGGEALQDRALSGERPLREELRQCYRDALGLYYAGEDGPRGCFLIGTALTEAVKDPAMRAAVAESLRALDRKFERRLKLAKERGELPRDADPAALARFAASVVHTLAIRSRAGEPRRTLERDIETGLDMVCGRRDRKTA
jgi:AcrR family transcriptional regulator